MIALIGADKTLMSSQPLKIEGEGEGRDAAKRSVSRLAPYFQAILQLHSVLPSDFQIDTAALETSFSIFLEYPSGSIYFSDQSFF